MTSEANGNGAYIKPTSSSNEDLSEYTDADESISAPTEFLAEFLSAVMLKDYETALKYCKLILQYEPNNATAKEFYPLILERLEHINGEEESGNDNDSEEDENSEDSSSLESECSTTTDESSEQEEEEEEGVEAGRGADKQSKGSSDGDATTGSYSSLEDDEAETIDQLVALTAKYQIDNVNLGNGNKIYGTSSLGSTYGEKLSNAGKSFLITENQAPVFGSSDSESPTEPLQTVAMLRAKVVPNKI